MKKIITKQFMLTLVGIFTILLVVIISCKKQDESSGSFASKSTLMQFYDSKLVESFKQEPVAKEFLQEVSKIPIKVVNGMLSFNSVEDYNKVYDLIVAYTDKYDALIEEDTKYAKYADFTYSESNSGIVTFYCNTHSPASGVYFEWNFGDGSAIANSIDDEILYSYAKNGSYNVKLTVYYGDGTHSQTRNKTVNITHGETGDCCKGNDRDAVKDFEYDYCGEHRRIKEVIRVTNNYLSHCIVAKTKHFYKYAGCWYLRNAAVINAGFSGYIFDTNCANPQYLGWLNSEKTNHFQRVFEYGMGHYNQFTVGKNSMHGVHKVVIENGIVMIDGIGDAAVHDKNCN